MFEFFGLLVERSSGTYNLELHDVVGNDEHVVALVTERGSRSGRTLDTLATHVWHVKDGKAVEFWGMAYDAYAGDAFWS